MRMLSPYNYLNASVDFDQFVDSFLQPTCDISETDDHYLASFDMPGVRKEDIKIELKNNKLAISGERHGHGKFERSLTLSATVDSQKIEALYENGVLNIALPKAEMAKPKTIQIQSGEESVLFKNLLKDTH